MSFSVCLKSFMSFSSSEAMSLILNASLGTVTKQTMTATTDRPIAV